MTKSVINTAILLLLIWQPCVTPDDNFTSIQSSKPEGVVNDSTERNYSIVRGPFLEAASIDDNIILPTEKYHKLSYINKSEIPEFRPILPTKYPQLVPPASHNWVSNLLILGNLAMAMLLMYTLIKKRYLNRPTPTVRLPTTEETNVQDKINSDHDQTSI